MEYIKNYTKENYDKVLAYHRKHYLENSDRIKKNVSSYRKNNPEKKQHLENQRRVKKAGNGGSHTLQERIEKFNKLGNVCFYCKKDGKMTIDHDIPIVRGGTDNIDNILPACRSCNSKKHDKTADEFISFLSAIGGIGPKANESQNYQGR